MASTAGARGASAAERATIAELLGDLAQRWVALLRAELALARQELREKLVAMGVGVLLAAAGALLLIVAGLALLGAGVLALAERIGAWQAALVVAAVTGVAGGGAALGGVWRLRRTGLKPEQTLESLKEGKEWLRGLI